MGESKGLTLSPNDKEVAFKANKTANRCPFFNRTPHFDQMSGQKR